MKYHGAQYKVVMMCEDLEGARNFRKGLKKSLEVFIVMEKGKVKEASFFGQYPLDVNVTDF